MSKWISIKDKLPEIGNQAAPYNWSSQVLCYLTDKTIHLMHLTDQKFWQNFEGKYSAPYDVVTHWQPLPLPPEE